MNNSNNKKILILVLIVLFLTLINLYLVSAAVWKYGSMHQHTGYSTKFGYDRLPGGGDDCWSEGWPWDWHLGYTVAELKEDALDKDIKWLSFTDHSYCLDSSEFNIVKTDCQNAQDSDFTCLWGEELSVDEDVDDIEPLCIYDSSPITRTAHLGAYGIPNFIEQNPVGKLCPNSPGAQEGINLINAGGLSVINHPYTILEQLDFESINVVSGETAIEIWNGEWEGMSDDSTAHDMWLNKLQAQYLLV